MEADEISVPLDWHREEKGIKKGKKEGRIAHISLVRVVSARELHDRKQVTRELETPISRIRIQKNKNKNKTTYPRSSAPTLPACLPPTDSLDEYRPAQCNGSGQDGCPSTLKKRKSRIYTHPKKKEVKKKKRQCVCVYLDRANAAEAARVNSGRCADVTSFPLDRFNSLSLRLHLFRFG